ncbi:hypothetical protein [Altererythrobacter sp. ZODW24]|uniref:hypothetical protein n=1 Tax=Altererythrobacter sp. ZODW24 TaxID=2185142 RepID=UPI000DF83625|nr:hypothetical protein [Altererythrobacter sp. ZODW24]
MSDTTRESDRILNAAGTSLQVNREGGYHRPADSIGQGSRRLKKSHWKKKLGILGLAVAGLWVASSIVGVVIGGLGFSGLMATALATIGAVFVFSRWPKMKVPRRENLNKGDVRKMVGNTELWLEAQRPALPAPAVKIVEDLGVQLDALGMQLETIDQNHPAARDVRKLVGEHLPETIDSYRKIPAHLRQEERAGATPDKQVAESLGRISKEIDEVTRQLADGALDDLAVRTRYLDYRYGENEETSSES